MKYTRIKTPLHKVTSNLYDRLMAITYDWREIDFDEEKWEDMINSDMILSEQSIHSETIDQKKDLLKLSSNHLKSSIFLHTDKFLCTNRSMSILIPPSIYQRVRYENECKHILRYISVPNNGTFTIEIPDLRNILHVNDVLWIRITRTTINHRHDNLIFFHPYPIWIKNINGIIHNGSIFIPITDIDSDNGFIQLDTLAIIRLKQEELKKIKTLSIYSSRQLNFFDCHSIEIETAKQIRDNYQLRQSILNFQLVRVDQYNMAYPTDCLCQTEILQECEANEHQQQIVRFRRTKIKKSKKIKRRKRF